MQTQTSARAWLGLIAVSLGVALIVVDTTIVNVIIAPIIDDLGISSVQAQWIQESYAIVVAALLLLTGRLADLFGARRIFLAGVVIFGATSVLAAVASTGELLIAARFLQGVGAALLLPASLALVNATFGGPDRGKAFAVWGSTIGAGAAIGPLLGGWLADFSWRWAFGINVPLGLLVIAGVLAFLAPSPRVAGRIDVIGALLSIVGLGLLAFALIEGRTYGWVTVARPVAVAGFSWESGPSPVLVALLVSALVLVAFVRRQLAMSHETGPVQPLMDVRLFAISSFRNGNIAALIISLGEFGLLAVLPLWLQFTLGYTPLEAGFALATLAVGSFVSSGASFGMAATIGPLLLVRIGLLLEAVGLAGLGLIASTGSSWWQIGLALFIYGVGIGFATAQVTNVVMADVPGPSAGQGSAIQSAGRQVGSALGIALLTTVFFSIFSARLFDSLTSAGAPAAQATSFTSLVTDSAGGAIAQLAAQPETAAVAEAAGAAMSSGIALASFLCAVLILLGFAATALIPAKTSAKPVDRRSVAIAESQS